MAEKTVKLSEVELEDVLVDCEIPSRYEIHIKKEHFNFYFAIVHASFIANNIMVAQAVPIKDLPGGGVYKTAEEATIAAMQYLMHFDPDAKIVLNETGGKDDSENR